MCAVIQKRKRPSYLKADLESQSLSHFVEIIEIWMFFPIDSFNVQENEMLNWHNADACRHGIAKIG